MLLLQQFRPFKKSIRKAQCYMQLPEKESASQVEDVLSLLYIIEARSIQRTVFRDMNFFNSHILVGCHNVHI